VIPIESLLSLIVEMRARMGASIGAIGILSAIIGIICLFVTVILEHMKKRRYAHRSKVND